MLWELFSFIARYDNIFDFFTKILLKSAMEIFVFLFILWKILPLKNLSSKNHILLKSMQFYNDFMSLNFMMTKTRKLPLNVEIYEKIHNFYVSFFLFFSFYSPFWCILLHLFTHARPEFGCGKLAFPSRMEHWCWKLGGNCTVWWLNNQTQFNCNFTGKIWYYFTWNHYMILLLNLPFHFT